LETGEDILSCRLVPRISLFLSERLARGEILDNKCRNYTEEEKEKLAEDIKAEREKRKRKQEKRNILDYYYNLLPIPLHWDLITPDYFRNKIDAILEGSLSNEIEI
jgi:hypothetical protein